MAKYLKSQIVMNWNQYKEHFPDRYLQPGWIDQEITSLYQSQKAARMTGNSMRLRILDIGGGVQGTAALNPGELTDDLYLLDPYIERLPDGYVDHVTWEQVEDKFDLIVARGVLNYLTGNQLKQLPLLLKKTGVFVANSFVKPTQLNRPYLKAGVNVGREITTFSVLPVMFYADGILKHTLQPYQGEPIEHNIWYYTLEKYLDLWTGYEVNLHCYGTNSVVLKLYGC